jgi:hypothetical protein
MHLGAFFRLNFSCALLSMVSSPFASPWGVGNFRSILSRLCRAVALVLGDQDLSHSSDLFLAFGWLLISCLSFYFTSFLFLFSLNWLLVCVVNALIKGEIEDRRVRGPVDALLAVMSDWQRGVDYSWPSIAGAGCGLICIGAGEDWARNVYALRGFRGVERQVGLSWGTSGQRGQVRAAWWQEKQDKVIDRSRCKVVAHNQSLHTGFAVVHHKTVRLLGWATKLRPEARPVETGSGRIEKLQCRRTRGEIAGLALGGRGLRRRRGRALKRSATWPICPWGVCITT